VHLPTARKTGKHPQAGLEDRLGVDTAVWKVAGDWSAERMQMDSVQEIERPAWEAGLRRFSPTEINRWRTAMLVLAAILVVFPPQSSAADSAATDHFEKRVRPLLIERCHKCHAGEKVKGNLHLDSAPTPLLPSTAVTLPIVRKRAVHSPSAACEYWI